MRDKRNAAREGAAASLQSRSWPPSSSAEHSLALGEEERVERLRYALLTGHTVQLEAGLCVTVDQDANIKVGKHPPAVEDHCICK